MKLTLVKNIMSFLPFEIQNYSGNFASQIFLYKVLITTFGVSIKNTQYIYICEI